MDSLFQAAADAYRNGKRNQRQPSAAATGRTFDHLLSIAVAARLSRDEQLLGRAASGARSRALKAARNGQLDIARQALSESAQILQSGVLSAEARLFLKSFHEAVAAYLDFKRGEPDLARARVERALAADCVLISQYGYDILELHRIQLGHNLMRVEARFGEPQQATAIGAALLSYTEGDNSSWPFPRFGDGARPDHLPDELAEAMVIQISGELAILLAGKPAEETVHLLSVALPHIEGIATDRCNDHLLAHQWLRAKWGFARQAWPAFFENLSDLLRDGLADAPLLWRASVADLYVACEALDKDGAEALRREIAEDVRAWPRVPEPVRAVFARSREATAVSI